MPRLLRGRSKIVIEVGVELPRHPRMLRIPPEPASGTCPALVRAASLGVWLTACCYTRAEELSGFVPPGALEGYATPEVVAWLIDVGLFAREEKDGVHGYQVLRYGEWNETAAHIDERLRIQREQKQAVRARPTGQAPDKRKTRPGRKRDKSETIARQTPDDHGPVPVPVPKLNTHTAGTHARVEDERALELGDALPEELRQAAAMLSVQDIDGAWLKFVGHYAGRVIRVAGQWQKWCVTEAKQERTARDRKARYEPPPGAQAHAQVLDEEAHRAGIIRRQRERDEEFAKLKGQAVLPDQSILAKLLGSVGNGGPARQEPKSGVMPVAPVVAPMAQPNGKAALSQEEFEQKRLQALAVAKGLT